MQESSQSLLHLYFVLPGEKASQALVKKAV